MSPAILVFGAIVAVLLALLVLALRSDRAQDDRRVALKPIEESGRKHVNLLPQMQQAFKTVDDEFLSRVGPHGLRGRVIRERRRVARSYLSALRQDFEELVQIAGLIAVLSPQVAAAQELERLRLRMSFLWRYKIVWLSLRLGFAPFPQINDLSNLISGYSFRLEEAMKDLGERAALVAEMMSSPDRRRIHPV
jgi:hypothetical protein